MEIECRHPEHSYQPIISLCSFPLCQLPRLCCMSCILSTHKAHIDFMIKLADILSSTTRAPSLLNWPKDPLISSLGTYFKELSKKEKGGYYEEKPFELQQDPFSIVESLLEELQSGFCNRINEIRVLLKGKVRYKDFSTPLKALSLQQVYEDTFDLNPVKEVLEGYLNHFIDYHRLEMDLKGFFARDKFKEAANFIKKQLGESSFPVSYDNFQAFKAKIIGLLQPRELQSFLLGLKDIDFESPLHSNLKPQTLTTPSLVYQNQNPIKQKIPIKSPSNFLGKRTFHSNTHSDWVYSIEYLKGTHFFCSAGADKSIKLWDFPSRIPLKTFLGHKDTIKSLHYMETPRLLASCSYDRTIKLWDPFNQYLFGEFIDKCSVNSVKSFENNRKLISAGDDNLIKLWDLEGGFDTPLRILQGHQNSVQSLLEIKEHALLASGSWDKQVKLWDLRSKDSWATLLGHNDWVQALEGLPEWGSFVSGAKDGELILWDLRVLKPLEKDIGVKRQDGKGLCGIRSLSLMKGLGYLAIATGDKVKIRGLNGGDTVMILEGSDDEVLEVKFVEETKELLVCSKDKTIGIWS